MPEQYRQSIDFEINDPQGRDAEVYVRMIEGAAVQQVPSVIIATRQVHL